MRIYVSGFGANPYPYFEAVAPQNPGWSWVDPLKDGQASQLKISEAMSTRRREAAAQGVDWDENLAELIDEETALAELIKLRAANNRLLVPAAQGQDNQGEDNAPPEQ